VKLDEFVPQKVSVPGVILSTPKYVSTTDTNTQSYPKSLSPSCTINIPINYLSNRSQPDDDYARGSVGLVGLLLKDEPHGEQIPGQKRSGVVLQPSKEADHAPPSEIPLSKRLAYLLQPPTDVLLSQIGPLEWPGSLFDYQIEGIKALLSRDALLLADDMGLGKTIQAIGALRILFLQNRIEACLLIVPASLVGQWRKEIHHWAPELRISTIRGTAAERTWQWATPAHIYLTSYETFRSDCTDNLHSPPVVVCGMLSSLMKLRRLKIGMWKLVENVNCYIDGGLGRLQVHLLKIERMILLQLLNLFRLSKKVRHLHDTNRALNFKKCIEVCSFAVKSRMCSHNCRLKL